MREIEALEAQWAELRRLVSEFGRDEWHRPTRCAELDVRELLAHIGDTLAFAHAFQPGDAPGDRYSFYAAFDGERMAPRVAESAKTNAKEKSNDEVLAWVTEQYESCLTYLREKPGTRVAWKGIGMTKLDMAATRCVELGVHTADIGHATLKGERIAPACQQVVADVFTGVLGKPLPCGMGWDPRTLILTGAGRRPLSPNEAHTLGDLAAKFPVVQ